LEEGENIYIINMQFGFEKLEVWNLAIALGLSIYKASEGFPSNENYVLTTQIKRASISVFSNIAEGNNRPTQVDRKRYFSMAYTSLMEVLNQLIFAHKLGYITTEQYDILRQDIEKLSNKLNALVKSIIT
jgi:four helix bundle protein